MPSKSAHIHGILGQHPNPVETRCYICVKAFLFLSFACTEKKGLLSFPSSSSTKNHHPLGRKRSQKGDCHFLTSSFLLLLLHYPTCCASQGVGRGRKRKEEEGKKKVLYNHVFCMQRCSAKEISSPSSDAATHTDLFVSVEHTAQILMSLLSSIRGKKNIFDFCRKVLQKRGPKKESRER